MLKKTMVALAALIFTATLAAPKANAQVSVGVGIGPIGVAVGRPAVIAPPYVVAAPPAPYVAAAPAPYVAVAPGYAYPPYVYPGYVLVGGRWYPRSYYRRYGYVGPRPYRWVR